MLFVFFFDGNGMAVRDSRSLTCVFVQFIRYLQIPYCSLYDMGYTSLGGTTDTFPNPILRIEDGDDEYEEYDDGGDGDDIDDGKQKDTTQSTHDGSQTQPQTTRRRKRKRAARYRPAYELMEDGQERLGRDG